MKSIILFLFFLVSTSVWAGTMTVQTGFGYITDSKGNIVAKEQLSPGTHPLTDGYTYTEVTDKEALDAIAVVSPTNSVQNQQELNAQALQEIIAKQIASDPKLSAQQAAIPKS